MPSSTKLDIFTLLSLYYYNGELDRDPHPKFNKLPGKVSFSELCRFYYGTGESFWERGYDFDRGMMMLFHNYFTTTSLKNVSIQPLDFYLSILAHIYDAILTSEMATVEDKEKVNNDYIKASIRTQTKIMKVNRKDKIEATFYDFVPQEKHLFTEVMGMGDRALTGIRPNIRRDQDFNMNWDLSLPNNKDLLDYVLKKYNNNSTQINKNSNLDEAYFWIAHFRRVYSFLNVIMDVYGTHSENQAPNWDEVSKNNFHFPSSITPNGLQPIMRWK